MLDAENELLGRDRANRLAERAAPDVLASPLQAEVTEGVSSGMGGSFRLRPLSPPRESNLGIGLAQS